MARKPKNPNPKLSKAAQERRRDIDNARRRYKRQADRYEKEAASLTGRDAEILQNAAQSLRARSDDLKGINVRKKLDNETKALIKDSTNYLASNNRTAFERGETLGKLRLSGSNLGHRFFALTEQFWEGIPSTGLGDDRRLNAIRRELMSRPDLVEKYGARPDANTMIEIVESISGLNLEDLPDWNLIGTDDEQFMVGLDRFTNYYG